MIKAKAGESIPGLRGAAEGAAQRSRTQTYHAEARVQIAPIGVIDGNLPPRALALVVEWATLHQVELLENWRRLQADEPPARIAPLE